jgi:hypothetical protein
MVWWWIMVLVVAQVTRWGQVVARGQVHVVRLCRFKVHPESHQRKTNIKEVDCSGQEMSQLGCLGCFVKFIPIEKRKTIFKQHY